MITICRRSTIFVLVCMTAFLAADEALAQSQSTLEIIASDSEVSYADDAAWGWLSPHKYDTWVAGEDEGFRFQGLRLVTPYVTYGLIMGWDTYPKMQVAASLTDDESGERLDYEIATDIEVFDLAINQPYAFATDSSFSPFLGATMMLLNEERILVGSEQDKDSAKTRLLGVIAGVDVIHPLTAKVTLEGRLTARWGSGDRDATISSTETGQGVERVTVSDSTDRIMYEAQLGLSYAITPVIRAGAGWQRRSWEYDDGPGSFDGFFLRLAIDI